MIRDNYLADKTYHELFGGTECDRVSNDSDGAEELNMQYTARHVQNSHYDHDPNLRPDL